MSRPHVDRLPLVRFAEMGWVSATKWSVGFAGAYLIACGPTVTVDDAGSDPGSTSVGDGSTGTPSAGTSPNPDPDTGDTGVGPGPAMTNQVDILFVVDNSGSMGEEQGELGVSAVQLANTLAGANLDLHIGVTTTDNGNPWCDGTTPEAGDFRMSSCRSRQAEFFFQGAVMVDATQEACLDVCETDSFTIEPTPGPNGGLAPRPWLEVTAGQSNVAGIDIGEAVRCMLPQGINGCGFEQPLESMYKAVLRSQNDSENAFGFFRAGALPVVIIVSDEADCSHSNEQDTIFLPDGDRTFWSLPDEGAPTSAVCWNAGVSCEGPQCNSVNLDPLGNPTSEADAVMRPVSRYAGLLQELEDSAATVTPGVDVLFHLIGGVGSDGSVVYQDTPDQQFQDDFGIGPGCTSPAGQAVPPVRMREVAEGLATPGATPLHSICDPNYDGAFSAIATQILAELGL